LRTFSHRFLSPSHRQQSTVIPWCGVKGRILRSIDAKGKIWACYGLVEIFGVHRKLGWAEFLILMMFIFVVLNPTWRVSKNLIFVVHVSGVRRSWLV